MDEPLKRLLFTEEPHSDESFIGYVLRIAGLNEIPDVRWIFRLAASRGYADSGYNYTFDFKVNTFALSKIIGIDETKLKDLLYVHPQYGTKKYRQSLLFFNHSIHQDLINRGLPKLCPACLTENNYCLKIWEAAFITACPVHKCLLLAYCPSCDHRLGWSRPKVHLCRCGYDFRNSNLILLKDKKLRLVNYFYDAFGLSSENPKVTLGYPLNTLNPDRLLKLLYFMLAYYEGSSDYSGYRIAIYRGNERTHKQLSSAVEVFDNWAVKYHKFIKSWSRKYRNQYVPYKPMEFERFRLPSAYEQYESFNIVLRCYFRKMRYPFLFDEFVNFLKQLPSEDASEHYLLDYL